MKEEEKYIQSLFEAARQEEPQISFEEVSETLATSLSPGMGAVMKGWFFKHIYLNSFIVLVSIAALSFLAFGNIQSENKQTAAIPNIESTTAIVNVEKARPILTEEESQIQQEEKTVASSSNEIETKIPSVKVSNRGKLIPYLGPAKQVIVEAPARIEYPKPTKNTKSINEKVLATTGAPTTDVPTDERKGQTTESAKIEVTEVPDQTNQTTTNIDSRDTRSELEVILETALNEDELKDELFVINAEGELAQLLVLTNGEFTNLIDINFANKKAIVMKNAYDGSFNLLNDDYVNVKEFNVKRNTAILKFTYNAVKVQIDLEKDEDIWVTTNIVRDDNQQEHLEKERLIQLALDHKTMKTLIERNKDGNYKKLLLIANDFLSSTISVEFENKPIEIVLQKSNHQYNRRALYAEIKKFHVKRKRATLEFSYKGKKGQISYRKKNEEWHIQSFKIF